MTQNGTYPTGTYVNKDGEEKVALSARAAVKLTFEGYSLKEESTEPAEVVEDDEPADEPSTALVHTNLFD